MNTSTRVVYRWWPTILTGVIGFTLAGLVGYACNFLFENHDIRIVMSFVIGCFLGFPIFAVCMLVHDRRNPW